MRQEFTFNLETMPIDRIALFDSAEAAEVFLREVFPLYTQCIVASADGKYPIREDLRAKVLEALLQDEKIRVIVFNFGALKKIKLKTDRVLVMDDLIMQDYKEHPSERILHFNLNAEKIAFLMECFYKQWEKMARIGNMNFAYENFKEYNQAKFNWKSALLSDNLTSKEKIL